MDVVNLSPSLDESCIEEIGESCTSRYEYYETAAKLKEASIQCTATKRSVLDDQPVPEAP